MTVNCANCRHVRYCEVEDSLVCIVEGVSMEPFDSCTAFEPRITKKLWEEALKNANYNIAEARLNLSGYRSYYTED